MSNLKTRGRALAIAGVIVIGAALVGCDQQGQESPSATAQTPSPSVSPSTGASVSPSPSVVPSTTPSAIVTAPAPDEVPGRVTAISAGPGGGSGEVVVDWDTVADATGYRVYRSDAPGGPFSPAASIDVGTGTTTVETGVSHEYIQIWASSTGSFQYVEVVADQPAYFRVAAFNDSGEGPRSAVVCGVSMTSSGTC